MQIYGYLDIKALKSLREVNKFYAKELRKVFNEKELTLSNGNIEKFEILITYIESTACRSSALFLLVTLSCEQFARLVDALNKAPMITSLFILSELTDSKDIGRLRYIRTLTLECDIDNQSLKAIFNSPSLQKSLVELQLRPDEFRERSVKFTVAQEGLQDLGKLNLIKLSISNLNIENFSELIFNMLQLQTRLKHLDLSYNGKISSQCVYHLDKLNLESLLLRGNKIDDQCLDKICSLPNLQKKLKILDISNNFKLTLEGISNLDRLNLTCLDLFGNDTMINNNQDLEAFCNLTGIQKLNKLSIYLLEFNNETCILLAELKNLSILHISHSSYVYEYLYDQLKTIFDSIPDLTIITDGKEIRLSNLKSFVDARLAEKLECTKGKG